MAHPLLGADPGTLAAAFRAGGRPDRLGAAAAIWAGALARSPASALEHALTARRLPAAAELEPVFIVGHWRSGTTHLYNALALGGFAFPRPADVGLPWDMLGLARILTPLLDRALPESRWIDRVPVTPQSPQEDEIALASMSPLSFFHALYFPRRLDALIDRGLFFDGCAAAEIAGWEARCALFLRRLAHAQRTPRLLVKNPAHSARIARLRRMFPAARFVHIHRDPLAVTRSMRHFYERLLGALALQRAEGLDIEATVLRVYDRLMRALVADAAALPRGAFVELSYDALEADPMAALERIHDGLGLGGFAAARGAYAGYFAAVAGYRKNDFAPDPAADARAAAALAPWIARWGREGP
jgi:hypothetical protein